MKNKADEKPGLSTYDALGTLHDELEKLLGEYRPKCSTFWTTMKDILGHNNEHSTFSWISCALICFNGVALLFSSAFVESSLYGNLVFQGFVVISLGFLNVLLVTWDNWLRKEEIPSRIRTLLHFVKECQEKCIWRVDNYPHLCSPYSPCITLQWTYRDGRLINLPWALLVRGDTILLRPGQPAPGNCFPHDTSGTPLSCGEVYTPPQKHDHLTVPVARVPFSNRRYILQETPLLRNVREVLECSAKNNLTCYDKLRHLVLTGCIQNLALPLLVICTVLINALRYVYVGQWVGSAHWSVMFLLVPASVSLPLLPLLFPTAWLVLNTFGNAKLSAFLQSSASAKVKITCGLQAADPFEDISIHECVEEIEAGVKWGQHFFHALLGQQHSLALTRSANPLHILGSVTALCCVDKKGILSWPNPTAEKVFFLRTSSGKSTLPSESNIVEQTENPPEEAEIVINEDGEDEIPEIEQDPPKPSEPDPPQTVVEVLDLTHDLSCPFRLHFDDTSWKEHIGSLKPIGLAILLNTCNMATQEHYIQFCSHVTCEALYNEDLVPVTNRRCPPCVREVSTLLSNNKCLCELSKQIGFTDNLKKSYVLKEQLSTFRHVQPETVRRDIKFARSLALATKLKLPFPHMVAVVTSEVSAPNSLQLFSQATGDIALDSCVDFWDGSTLRPLTNSDRKKILDFYQRTSLTAYCTAFAYRPLGRGVSPTLSRVYMELPADSHTLYLRNRSPTPLDWQNPILSQSTDSLLAAGDSFDDDVTDIEGCFEMQCNQIFLGMVTMQYQAQIEMVQLIEQLERACIRFVHFSKENELRSRVFSEKMGLESGWNCHISLLSSGSLEGSRTMSVSAPCAINTESTKETNENQRLEEEMEVSSQHEGWQSLSCLTDSTEQSAHINFDMSNRAKLPRGIDQIRPHLEKVDNVPLLVSLFTDCTPSTTQQMIGIMQDYGEVVCVLGSSANADNSSIFLKANASVSVEPLYPQVCQKVAVYTGLSESVSPVQLSQRLNSLPCSVSVSRQRPVSLYQLIMHARHNMQCLWNCVQFWVCCMLTLSILQVISTIVMVPPIITSGQVLWLSCIIVPALSLSLVHSPTNPQVMQRPMPKNQTTVNSEMAIFVLWCYGLKFLPILLIVPLVYAATLANHCNSIILHEVNGTCNLIYPASLQNEKWGGWEKNTAPLSNAQTFASSLFVLHLVTVSVSFVHRECLSWLRSPLRNKVWAVASLLVLIVQCSYTVTSVGLLKGEEEVFRYGVPWTGLSFAAISPVIIFLVNEFVKWQEIKANVRYEKRARLDFGTKLGMNSPF